MQFYSTWDKLARVSQQYRYVIIQQYFKNYKTDYTLLKNAVKYITDSVDGKVLVYLIMMYVF